MCLKGGLLRFWALSGIEPWMGDFYGVGSNRSFNAMGIQFPSVYWVPNETFSTPGELKRPPPPAASATPFCDLVRRLSDLAVLSRFPCFSRISLPLPLSRIFSSQLSVMLPVAFPRQCILCRWKLLKNILKDLKTIKNDDGDTQLMSHNFTLEILMIKNALGSKSQ